MLVPTPLWAGHIHPMRKEKLYPSCGYSRNSALQALSTPFRTLLSLSTRAVLFSSSRGGFPRRSTTCLYPCYPPPSCQRDFKFVVPYTAASEQGLRRTRVPACRLGVVLFPLWACCVVVVNESITLSLSRVRIFPPNFPSAFLRPLLLSCSCSFPALGSGWKRGKINILASVSLRDTDVTHTHHQLTRRSPIVERERKRKMSELLPNFPTFSRVIFPRLDLVLTINQHTYTLKLYGICCCTLEIGATSKCLHEKVKHAVTVGAAVAGSWTIHPVVMTCGAFGQDRTQVTRRHGKWLVWLKGGMHFWLP